MSGDPRVFAPLSQALGNLGQAFLAYKQYQAEAPARRLQQDLARADLEKKLLEAQRMRQQMEALTGLREAAASVLGDGGLAGLLYGGVNASPEKTYEMMRLLLAYGNAGDADRQRAIAIGSGLLPGVNVATTGGELERYYGNAEAQRQNELARALAAANAQVEAARMQKEGNEAVARSRVDAERVRAAGGLGQALAKAAAGSGDAELLRDLGEAQGLLLAGDVDKALARLTRARGRLMQAGRDTSALDAAIAELGRMTGRLASTVGGPRPPEIDSMDVQRLQREMFMRLGGPDVVTDPDAQRAVDQAMAWAYANADRFGGFPAAAMYAMQGLRPGEDGWFSDTKPTFVPPPLPGSAPAAVQATPQGAQQTAQPTAQPAAQQAAQPSAADAAARVARALGVPPEQASAIVAQEPVAALDTPDDMLRTELQPGRVYTVRGRRVVFVGWRGHSPRFVPLE